MKPDTKNCVILLREILRVAKFIESGIEIARVCGREERGVSI